MPTALYNGFAFLIRSVFDFYILLIILRGFFQWFSIDFHNPITQFIVKATQPIIKPLQKILPQYKRFSFASLLLAISLTMMKFLILLSLLSDSSSTSGTIGMSWTLLQLITVSIGSLLSISISLFFYSTLIVVILSWINPPQSPLTEILHGLTEPLLIPIRQIIPLMAGIDLSALIFMIGLQFISITLVTPLMRGYF